MMVENLIPSGNWKSGKRILGELKERGKRTLNFSRDPQPLDQKRIRAAAQLLDQILLAENNLRLFAEASSTDSAAGNRACTVASRSLQPRPKLPSQGRKPLLPL